MLLGNATQVMDTIEYLTSKLADLIGHDSYSKIKKKKNPTLKTEKMPSQILSKNKDLLP